MVDGALFPAVWVVDEFPVLVVLMVCWCLGAGGDGGVNQEVSEVFIPSVG